MKSRHIITNYYLKLLIETFILNKRKHWHVLFEIQKDVVKKYMDKNYNHKLKNINPFTDDQKKELLDNSKKQLGHYLDKIIETHSIINSVNEYLCPYIYNSVIYIKNGLVFLEYNDLIFAVDKLSNKSLNYYNNISLENKIKEIDE